MSPQPRLAVHGLTVAYGRPPRGRVVIDGLDAEIPAGRFTVVIGPNACGKSTLLRTIARLHKPLSGTVELDGADVHKIPTRGLAQRLAVLPQSPLVPEGVSVTDLVARGRSPHRSWWRQWSPADEKAVTRAMDLAGVTDLATRPVDTLSGGQRQRVWIAMILAQDTDTLLLDEPTTYLDLAHQIEVLDLLRRLNTEDGRTIVAVLHDLNEAARYADEIIAMRDGRVITQGSPDRVITAATVASVFGLDCAVVACPVTGKPLVIPHTTTGEPTHA